MYVYKRVLDSITVYTQQGRLHRQGWEEDSHIMAMDKEAAARIMSAEYKKNDGKATDWSRKAQSAADKNESQSQPGDTSELKPIHSVVDT